MGGEREGGVSSLSLNMCLMGGVVYNQKIYDNYVLMNAEIQCQSTRNYIINSHLIYINEESLVINI